MKRTLVAALASLLLLLLVAFLYLHFVSHLSFHVSSQSNAVFNQPSAPHAKLAPGNFAFHTLDGNESHLSDFKGKVVFVNRWGTWCAPCVAEMPSIDKLYQRYKNDPQVAFLLIASDDSPERVRKFALAHHLEMPLYVTTDQDVSGINFATFPSTSLYGKDGQLTLHQEGGADWADPKIIARIESLKNQ